MAAKRTAERTGDRELEIYTAAREVVEGELNRLQADLEAHKAEIPAVREESEALGMLKKIEYDLAHNQMLKYAVLARVRDSKEYRKGGMTWEEFCEAIGEPKRTVDQKIRDIRPLVDIFGQSFAQIAGVTFSKVRYLGCAIQADVAQIEDGVLVVDGVKIPLKPENKEEIEALIDNLKETSQKEKAELERRAELDRKRLERDARAEIESLMEEKKALVKENQRLKVFDPEEKDRTWCEEQAKEIEKACGEFVICCSRFIMDERIADDRHLQALIDRHLREAHDTLHDLRRRLDELFGFEEID